MPAFVKIHGDLVNAAAIRSIDLSRVEELYIIVRLVDYTFVAVEGVEAVDLLMTLRPSSLEGRRLRWIRHWWAIHNLIGHPLMQILTWLGLPRWGLWVHEATVPRPRGKRAK